MPLITTPGDADADAYITLVDFKAYCDRYGHEYPAADDTAIEQAVRRATAGIDAKYRHRFLGEAASSSQALEWPRSDVTFRGDELPDAEIPAQVVRATAEAAVREIADPGSIAPDLERGGRIKSLQAGSVGVTYTDAAPAETTFTLIDGILSGLIGRGNATQVARA